MKLQFSPVNYIFGSPGAGKTTVLCKLSRQFLKRGMKVVSNTPMKGCYLINDTDLGYYDFGSNTAILLDEAGISYDNRKFKGGLMSDPARLQFWKLARHYLKGGFIIIASQSWEDVDKKIRDLSQSYFLIKRSILPWFTTIKPIFKKVDIDKTSHQPTDMYVIGGLSSWSWCFRPRYYKYFDSYAAPELPPYPYDVNNIC